MHRLSKRPALPRVYLQKGEPFEYDGSLADARGCDGSEHEGDAEVELRGTARCGRLFHLQLMSCLLPMSQRFRSVTLLALTTSSARPLWKISTSIFADQAGRWPPTTIPLKFSSPCPLLPDGG